MKLHIVGVVLAFLSLALSLAAQTASSNSASAQVPPLIQFSNIATDEGGNTLSGVVSITFSFYNAQQGGEPLWTETQSNVQLDSTGHYSVQLGITKPNGVPTTLFTTGEARWLGVKIETQSEQPRVYLVSVPYAMKAGDAATVGGLPPSAFVMAVPTTGSSTSAATGSDSSTSANSSLPPNGAITGSGTVDFIPLWDTTSDIISSVLFQSGTGSTAKIGVNTTTPAATLDVKGTAILRGTTSVMGTMTLPATGAATSSVGKNSQPITQTASAYDSSTDTAVDQKFQWQAEPVNNDTSTASGTLNLLYGQGTNTVAETGLHIAGNGQISFAAGQTFPGTGTITGVTTAIGSGLTGGGTSGSLNLGLTNACATNQVLQWNGSAWACATIAGSGTITGVTAGTDLTGGGTSGNVTLNLNTANIPQLNANNIFNGNQTIVGSLSASSFQIGSNLFAFGSANLYNVFLGFAGSSTSGGSSNTGVGFEALLNNNGTTAGDLNTAAGYGALQFNTSGSYNTALGGDTLNANTMGAGNTAAGIYALSANNGSYNTGVGFEAMEQNTTGTYNTALGYFAGPSALAGAGALTNTTAIGANAKVSQSNSLVLGQTDQGEPGYLWVSVGIGTDTPRSILEAAEYQPSAVGPVVTLTNPFPLADYAAGISAAAALDFNSYSPSTTGTYNPAARIQAQDAGTGNFSDNLFFLSNKPGAANNGLQTNMAILSTGQVGIGTTAPAAMLEVNGTAKFDGLVTFASGQTFGSGGISSVTGTNGITSSTSSGAVTLSLTPFSQCASGSALTAVPFTCTPLSFATLGANTFAGNQSVTGNITASSDVQGAVVNATTGLDIGGVSFATGSAVNGTVALGFSAGHAGTANTGTGVGALKNNTGPYNTANGYYALYANTSGGFNTAVGFQALVDNVTTSGNVAVGYAAAQNNTANFNTAVGDSALLNNTTGTNNTALGISAGPSSGGLINTTAIGSNAVVSESNALVLGGTGSNAVNVGIGTTTPQYTLDVQGTEIGTQVAPAATVSGSNSATSGTSLGVSGTTSSPAGVGVVGENFSSGGTGVFGITNGTTDGSAGVVGEAEGPSTAATYGVYGQILSNSRGVGTFGQVGSLSNTGAAYIGDGGGIWGDSGDLGATLAAVVGTADDNTAGFFENNSPDNFYTLQALAVNSATNLFDAYNISTGGFCEIDNIGNLSCSGAITSEVPVDAGVRKVSLYSVQSPENWLEDFGSGTLSFGAATITLDPTFTQTVNTGIEYHVFLTPNGDSNGLYVSRKTATSFEVREQGGGHSSIAFDYRIVAKRSGYENVRLTDVTEQYKRMAEQRELQHGKPGQPPGRPSVLPPTIPKMPTPPALTIRAAAQPK